MSRRMLNRDTMDAAAMPTGCGRGSDNRTGIVYNGVLSMPPEDIRMDAVRTPAIQNSNVLRFGTLGNVMHSGPLAGPEESLDDLLGTLPDTLLVAGTSELQLLRFVPRHGGEVGFSDPETDAATLVKRASLLWYDDDTPDESLPSAWLAYNAELESATRELLTSEYAKSPEQSEYYASTLRIAMVLKLTKAIRETTSLPTAASSWYLKDKQELAHLCSMQLKTAIGAMTGMLYAASMGDDSERLDLRETNRRELEFLRRQADDVAHQWSCFVTAWYLPYMSRASIAQRIERGRHSMQYSESIGASDGVYLLTRDDINMVEKLPAAGVYDEQLGAIVTAWQPTLAENNISWVEHAKAHLYELVYPLSTAAKLTPQLRRRLGGYIAFGYGQSHAGAGRLLGSTIAGVDSPQAYGGLTRYLGIDAHGMDIRSMCAEVAPGEIAAFTECNNSAYSLSRMGAVVPEIRQYGTGAFNVYPDVEMHKLAATNEHMMQTIHRARGQHRELHEQCRVGGMYDYGVRSLSWGYGMNTMHSHVDEKWLNEVFQDYASTPDHDVYKLPFLAVVRDPDGPRPHVEHSRDPLVGIWAHGDIRDGVAVLTSQNSHAETVYGGVSHA